MVIDEQILPPYVVGDGPRRPRGTVRGVTRLGCGLRLPRRAHVSALWASSPRDLPAELPAARAAPAPVRVDQLLVAL